MVLGYNGTTGFSDKHTLAITTALRAVPKPPLTGCTLVDAQNSASHALAVTMGSTCFCSPSITLPLYERFQELTAEQEMLSRAKASSDELIAAPSFNNLPDEVAM